MGDGVFFYEFFVSVFLIFLSFVLVQSADLTELSLHAARALWEVLLVFEFASERASKRVRTCQHLLPKHYLVIGRRVIESVVEGPDKHRGDSFQVSQMLIPQGICGQFWIFLYYSGGLFGDYLWLFAVEVEIGHVVGVELVLAAILP